MHVVIYYMNLELDLILYVKTHIGYKKISNTHLPQKKIYGVKQLSRPVSKNLAICMTK